MSKKQIPYFQKLLDPRWQKKRLEVMESRGWACEICYDGDSTLHVHHKQYLKGREPWEYEQDQLALLCETCHAEQHENDDELNYVISRLPIDGGRWIDRRKAACLIAGSMGLDDFKIRDCYEEAWFYVGLSVYTNAETLIQKGDSSVL